MNTLNGAKYLIECLSKEGVDVIFGYPGGAVIPLFDALYESEDFIQIRTCHEQGASHAADGYARTTGKVGVCIATSGPGATNIITGLATAFMDSVPVIAITGQVGKSLLGKDSFQEIDITGLTMGITKHNFLVTDANDLKDVVSKAFYIAQNGRPGPVLIDISKDAFMQEIETKEYHKIDKTTDKRHLNYQAEIDKVVNLIKSSRQPVIYAGGGVIKSKSWDSLHELSTKHNIPVVNSIMGLGSFDRNSNLSYGIVGMHGDKDANMLCYESDLILGVGVRFSDRAIGNRNGFTKNATIVHIDVDETELGKNIDVSYEILGDLNEIMNEISTKLMEYKSPHTRSNDYLAKDYEGFHPKNILTVTQKSVPENTVVVTDVGQHQIWTAKFWKFSLPMKFATSGGLGTMGFGMGAALGAKLGNPDSHVLLITGDGSFRMNHPELLTLSRHNIPITILLFNNSSLGMVRQWQNLFCNSRYAQTDINDGLNLEFLSKAYGINYYKASDLDTLESILKVQDKSQINLIECLLDSDIGAYPIVPPGKSIDTLITED